MLDTATGGALRYELKERGYAELEHGISADQFLDLTSRYFEFSLAHPDPETTTMDAMLPPTPPDIKNSNWLDELDRSKDTQIVWHKYRTNTESPAKPNGYTNRSAQEEALVEKRGVILHEDPKEYYHWMPGHLEAMMANHSEFGWGPIPPEVIELDAAFVDIHKIAREIMWEVCREIEDQHPGLTKLITPASLLASPLRLLGYHHSDKPYLGEDHYDKSWITFQPGESHEGLLVAKDKESPLELVRRNADRGLVFMGKSLSDPEIGFFPDSPYGPAWHGIRNLDQPNQGQYPIPDWAQERFKRWALIFFAGNTDLQVLTKQDTHVR